MIGECEEMKRPIEKGKRRYVSDFTDEIDTLYAISASDCTGLIPSMPRSDEEVESYKQMYEFSPPYAEQKQTD